MRMRGFSTAFAREAKFLSSQLLASKLRVLRLGYVLGGLLSDSPAIW